MKKPQLLKNCAFFFALFVSIVNVYAQPANDNVANAVALTPTYTCGGAGKSTGTVSAATYVSAATSGSCTNVNAKDVWYKFVATSSTHTITLSNLGASWGSSARIQLLSNSSVDGSGTWTDMGCTSGTSPSLTTGALTIGNTYFIRIHRNSTSNNNGTNWGFDVCVTVSSVTAGRMRELFKYDILSAPNVLSSPWEVTYGPDNNLWVTEAKSYKVQKINPANGNKVTVLDLANTAAGYLTPTEHDTYNVGFGTGQSPWPQGGLAGLALHPKFLDGSGLYNFVYLSYVRSYTGGSTGPGHLFNNFLVRFTYNTSSNKLESPVTICDSLPGSNDHNSQRIFIAPDTTNGTAYLFYASGDMGAGQGVNYSRPIKAQLPESYEGKILRFNLEPDGDPSATTDTRLNPWIPNEGPYEEIVGKQTAVWAIGMRNNQGFAYDSTTNKLYGTSHGPYSDDELNIIEKFKNYGHPLVIGYYADGNYNGTTMPITSTSVSAGSSFGTYGGQSRAGVSTCPPIGNETTRRGEINAAGHGAYKDPLFSAYAYNVSGQPNVSTIWSQSPNTPGNDVWPSEGWSGLDLYTKSIIPGWKRSLVAAGLKWGRLLRLKLNPDGSKTLPSGLSEGNTTDTVTYLQSSNRYRDMAFAPNGRDIYIIMDNSASSVATDGNPQVAPACQGCLVRYTFLGYSSNTASGNRSNIPTSIPVGSGIPGSFQTANKVVINSTVGNNNVWVPITDTNSNVIAEINARGQNLDTVTTTLLTRTGASRAKNSKFYVNRNLTITPKNQPADSVWIRLYVSAAEFAQFTTNSGVGTISALKIIKNSDSALTAMNLATKQVNTTVAESFNGSDYVLQGTIGEFSSFYFSNAAITLPVTLISFTGKLENNNVALKWQTENEVSTSHFIVERSTDGTSFNPIGRVAANGTGAAFNYAYLDQDAVNQSSAKLYYRLKMLDLDAQFTYSDIVTITMPYISGLVSVYPNPFATTLTVAIGAPKEGKIQWKLIDNNGRTVVQGAETLRKGNNTVQINVNKLSAGFYYLSIEGAGISKKVKLQKQ